MPWDRPAKIEDAMFGFVEVSGIKHRMSLSDVPPAKSVFQVIDLEENGAAYVTRTRDPIITNDVLYRLS